MPSFILRAPKLPPNDKITGLLSKPNFALETRLSARIISCLTGLPVNTHWSVSKILACVPQQPTILFVACLANILLVIPGNAFCSCITEGTPSFYSSTYYRTAYITTCSDTNIRFEFLN